MKSDRKQPIAKSPLRLRRTLRSGASTPMGTPSSVNPPARQAAANRFGWTATPKQQDSKFGGDKYGNMSLEFNALEKFVQDELGKSCSATAGFGVNSASVFERGRLYDVYCTRRNERLKRKLGGEGDWGVVATPMGYTQRTAAPRKKEMKVYASANKSSTAVRNSGYVASGQMDRSEHPRYALRSIKKPPLPVPMGVEHPRYALRNIKKPTLPVPMGVEHSTGGARKTRAVRGRKN